MDPQLRNFSSTEILDDAKLKLYTDSRRNKLIILSPRFEEWILAAAKESGLRLDSYNLPEDPDRLHEVINLGVEHFRGPRL